MVELILEANSTDIDSIAGSTETTEAIIKAVEQVILLATPVEIE